MTQFSLFPRSPGLGPVEAPGNAGESLAAPDSACPRCGRQWGGLVTARGFDMVAVSRLPAEERRRALECWIGRCSPRET